MGRLRWLVMVDPSDTSPRLLPRVLLVEDDEMFAAVVAALTYSQADVEWVASAEEALGVLHGEDWELTGGEAGHG
jgi:hypothetical protein